MTIDMTGTAHVKYMLLVGNAAAPTTFNNFRLYVGHSTDYNQNTECPGGPYLGPGDSDYVSDESRLGAEVACGATGRYVSLVKQSGDPGAYDTFEVCTLGVLATCDCSSLTLEWANSEEYFDRV